MTKILLVTVLLSKAYNKSSAVVYGVILTQGVPPNTTVEVASFRGCSPLHENGQALKKCKKK